MESKKALPFLFFAQFLSQFLIIHAKVSSIIVFGDSSVDPGNNNQVFTVLKSNFYPYGRDFYGGLPTGRFCNGRLATDFISEAFGLRPIVPAYLDFHYNIADFAKGVSFASAGTGYDNDTSIVLNVIPLWRELEYFKEYKIDLRCHLGVKKASQLLTDALYLISIGTNDFLENYFNSRSKRMVYSVEGYQDFLVGLARNFIKDLYHLGARKISLGGLPPMGCLPLEIHFSGKRCVERFNDVAREFNGKLQKLVKMLNKELAGIKLVYSDIYGIFSDILQNPHSFGFEVTQRACCATGRIEMSYLCTALNLFSCTDANKYVFWDSFHPTEKTNAIIAHHAINTSLAGFR